MKKLLILCACAAFFASCNTEDTTPAPHTGANYACTLKVTDAANGTATNEAEGIVCALAQESDESYSLTMKEIKFTDNPSEPVKTIVIKNLALKSIVNGSTEIYSTEATIVPEIGGTPYPDYVISGFSCILNSDQTLLRLVFTCTNTLYRINHTADFNGRISR